MNDDSVEMSGGAAHGVHGTMRYTKSSLDDLVKMMADLGEWVFAKAGFFLGHIKMALTSENGEMTLNLVNLKEGTEVHGKIIESGSVEFRFMAAVLGVDTKELQEKMNAVLRNCGLTADVPNDGKKIIKLG